VLATTLVNELVEAADDQQLAKTIACSPRVAQHGRPERTV
jgi:hypothetical protein